MDFRNDEYSSKENSLLSERQLSNIVALRASQDGEPDIQIVSVTCKGGLKEQIVVVRVDCLPPRLATDDEVGEIFDYIDWKWKNYSSIVKDGARVFIQTDKTRL